jgi:hypothetical protein
MAAQITRQMAKFVPDMMVQIQQNTNVVPGSYAGSNTPHALLSTLTHANLPSMRDSKGLLVTVVVQKYGKHVHQ